MTRLKRSVTIISAALGFRKPELNLILTDDSEIRRLNKQWRHIDRRTDVLSFSQWEGDETYRSAHPGRQVLGDVVISLPTAMRQAVRYKHNIEQELDRLVIHGLLHLLGHDHVRGGAQAVRMRAEERRLAKLLRDAQKR